ncbi:hypothetical protein LguiA_026145 [Lonicera macranthoides]
MNSISVLEGNDGFYFNKILSRDSSIGQSSHIYYRDTEGVPFKWEKQPGTPKNPPQKELIPPPVPPPAVQSLGLPRPCLDQVKDSKFSRSRIWFWKKRKEKEKGQRGYNSNSDSIASIRSERFDFGNSDGEFIGSPVDRSRSYSSSSSCSFSSIAHHLQLSRFKKYRQVLQFYCTPWSLTDIIDRIQRRAQGNKIEVDEFLFTRNLKREALLNNSGKDQSQCPIQMMRKSAILFLCKSELLRRESMEECKEAERPLDLSLTTMMISASRWRNCGSAKA